MQKGCHSNKDRISIRNELCCVCLRLLRIHPVMILGGITVEGGRKDIRSGSARRILDELRCSWCISPEMIKKMRNRSKVEAHLKEKFKVF